MSPQTYCKVRVIRAAQSYEPGLKNYTFTILRASWLAQLVLRRENYPGNPSNNNLRFIRLVLNGVSRLTQRKGFVTKQIREIAPHPRFPRNKKKSQSTARFCLVTYETITNHFEMLETRYRTLRLIPPRFASVLPIQSQNLHFGAEIIQRLQLVYIVDGENFGEY